MAVLFFISPILSLLIALRRTWKGEISSLYIIPLFMGLCAYLFPPFSDFARHIEKAEMYKSLSSIDFIQNQNIDFLFTYLEYFFIKNHIPIEIFRFLYTFIIFYLFCDIYKQIQRKWNLNLKDKRLIFLILVTSIPTFALIINVRAPFVYCSIFWLIFKYYTDGKHLYLYICLLILSILIHYFAIPFFLIFFIANKINVKIPKILILIFFLISLFSEIDFVNVILSKISISEGLDKHLVHYLEGGTWSEDGSAQKEMNTLNYKIFKELNALPLYTLIYMYFKYKYDSKMNSYINLWFIVLLLSSPIVVLFWRYSHMLEYALLAYIIIGYLNSKIPYKGMRLYAISIFISCFSNIYANYNCLVNGNIYAISTPVPYALSQTYDFTTWKKNRLTEDYNKFKNKTWLSR